MTADRKTIMLKAPLFGLIMMLGTMILSGCGKNPYADPDQSKQGALPLIETESFQNIDLALLLDPKVESCDNENCTKDPERLQKAFNKFYMNACGSLREGLQDAYARFCNKETNTDNKACTEDERERLRNAFDGFYEEKCATGRKELQDSFSTFCEQESNDNKELCTALSVEPYVASDVLKVRRNRVQDRIIAASNQRCAEHKRFLRRFDTTTNWLLGSLTTLTAGAGGIVTNVDTARTLSGIAGVASGIQSQTNEVYFHQRTVHILTKGLETRREKILDSIKKEQAKPIGEYNVERAVGDVIKYHDACSVIAGLEQVAEDQQRAKNPGIEEFEQTIKRVKSLSEDLSAAISNRSNDNQGESSP